MANTPISKFTSSNALEIEKVHQEALKTWPERRKRIIEKHGVKNAAR